MHRNLSDVKAYIGDTRIPLRVFADSDMRTRILEDGLWERHITVFFAALLPHFRSPLFFDVGANIGYYTVLAAKFGSRVVAFEPNSEVLPVLRQNIELNGCSDVVVEPSIVGDGSTAVRLIQTAKMTEESYAQTAADGKSDPAVSIDSYCADTGARPTVIKCDAEGRDIDVIKGALATLGKVQPIVNFEFQPAKIDAVAGGHPRDVFETLDAIGYTPYLFRGHSGSSPEPVDFQILERIYDIYAERRLKAYWDVLLWPPRLNTLAKQFNMPN